MLFAASEAVLLSRGAGHASLYTAAALAIFCALTRWFTSGTNADDPPRPGRRIAIQLLACVFVVAATGVEGARFNHVAPGWLRVPGWAELHDAIYAVAAQHMRIDIANGVTGFVLYCVPIALVLLALGVPLGQQGLGRFRRGSVATAIAWLIVPLSAFAWMFATGRIPVGFGLLNWLSNLLQNGVSEEFLWRGVIMGRLRAVMTSEAALYLQAALFGLWHFGAVYHAFNGDAVGMIAEMIVMQMTVGLALGYVTQRTGNIAIGSAFHLLFDSANDLFN